MSRKRNVEIFTAGCVCCDEAVAGVKRIAGPFDEITIHDMKQESGVKRAKELDIKRVPTVVIDGKIADCCAKGVDMLALRVAGLGTAL